METELPAGRELDAQIAEQVMGLRVVARDWPCGYLPDGCWLEASSQDADHLVFVHLYPERHPVYVAGDGIWPPEVIDDPDYAGQGPLAKVDPVPPYSTNIADAWQIVEHLRTCEMSVRVWSLYSDKYWCTITLGQTDETLCLERGETAPLAICRAALRAVESA